MMYWTASVVVVVFSPTQINIFYYFKVFYNYFLWPLHSFLYLTMALAASAQAARISSDSPPFLSCLHPLVESSI